VAVANDVLERTGDEGQAVAACSAAMDDMGEMGQDGTTRKFEFLATGLPTEPVGKFVWGLSVVGESRLLSFDLLPPPVGTINIRGVEIFKVGRWNGEDFVERDLDDMVASFGSLGYRPPVKLGHTDEPGAPAFGWVEGLRRDGDRLVADLAAVPTSLADLIKTRQYDAVSAEVYFNLARNGVKHRRALASVAILGAQVPAVDGLKPLHKTLLGFTREVGDELRAFTMEKRPMPDKIDDKADAATTAEEKARLAKLEQENAELIKKLGAASSDAVQLRNLQATVESLTKKAEAAEERSRQDHVTGLVAKLSIPAFRDHFRALFDMATADPARTVKFAVGKELKDVTAIHVIEDLVEKLNEATKSLFSTLSVATGDLRHPELATSNAGQEVDKRVRKYMTEHPTIKDYVEAQKFVLDADPDLKRRYAGFSH
jgi:hypothetical protein